MTFFPSSLELASSIFFKYHQYFELTASRCSSIQMPEFLMTNHNPVKKNALIQRMTRLTLMVLSKAALDNFYSTKVLRLRSLYRSSQIMINYHTVSHSYNILVHLFSFYSPLISITITLVYFLFFSLIVVVYWVISVVAVTIATPFTWRL